jgi:hypothetical protein
LTTFLPWINSFDFNPPRLKEDTILSISPELVTLQSVLIKIAFKSFSCGKPLKGQTDMAAETQGSKGPEADGYEITLALRPSIPAVASRDEADENLRKQVDDLKRRLHDTELKVRNLITENHEYRNTAARMASHPVRNAAGEFNQQHTITDVKDSESEDGLSDMKKELEVNISSLSTEIPVIPVENPAGGQAPEQIFIGMRQSPSLTVQPADRMTRHLEFWRLQMADDEGYSDFLARFLLLAQEAEVPRTQYKSELWDKLTREIQGRTVSGWKNENMGFDEFSILCSRVANSSEGGTDESQGRRIGDSSKTTVLAQLMLSAPGGCCQY